MGQTTPLARAFPLVCLGLMAVVLVCAAGLDLGPVRAPVGLAVGLFAPGWLLLRATAGRRLSAAHTSALMVPMSLAICALSGTLLTLAGIKLRVLPTALVVCAVTLACLIVAVRRGTATPPTGSLRLPSLMPTPRTAIAAALGLAVVAMGVSTVREVNRVDDAARASTPFVALTGRLESATRAGSGVRVRVAFTTINSQPRSIRPRLEISLLPGQAIPARTTLRVGPGRMLTVRRAFVAHCGDEIVADLGGDGVPSRTSTLRVSCPR